MNNNLPPNFYVRDKPICGDALLTPLDGYADWPFRSLCRAPGLAMSYTEFVKVEKMLSKSKQPAKKLYFEEAERPITFQLYGDAHAAENRTYIIRRVRQCRNTRNGASGFMARKTVSDCSVNMRCNTFCFIPFPGRIASRSCNLMGEFLAMVNEVYAISA